MRNTKTFYTLDSVSKLGIIIAFEVFELDIFIFIKNIIFFKIIKNNLIMKYIQII